MQWIDNYSKAHWTKGKGTNEHAVFPDGDLHFNNIILAVLDPCPKQFVTMFF